MIRLATVFFALLIPVLSFSQIKSYGLTGGLNLTPIDKTDVDGIIINPGYHGGLFVGYSINDNLSVEAEFLLTRTNKSYGIETISTLDSMLLQGLDMSGLDLDSLNMGGVDLDTTITNLITQYANTDIISRTKGNAALNYFTIPVTVSYRASKFKFSLGAYISILTKVTTTEVLNQDIPLLEALSFVEDNKLFKALISLAYPGLYEPSIDEYTSKTPYNPLDYGVTGGISYDINKSMFISLKYVHGLTNTFKNPEEGFSTWSKSNSYLKMSLGIDIGKTELPKQVMF